MLSLCSDSPPVFATGRLDRKIEFPHPNEEARAKILQVGGWAGWLGWLAGWLAGRVGRSYCLAVSTRLPGQTGTNLG